jgi:hypothetical protein
VAKQVSARDCRTGNRWLGLIVWFQLGPKQQSTNALRLSLGLPEGVTPHRNWHPFRHIALSPDGQMLAFAPLTRLVELVMAQA